MSLAKRVIPVAILVGVMSVPALATAQEEPEEASIVAQKGQSQFGVGARVRYIFMPTSVLNLFLDHSTPLSSFGVGAEVVRRKGNFDVVFGIEYDGVSPEDGLYLEQGDNPSTPGEYPDYVEFDGLALLGFDASFIWHADIASKVQFRYGGGIGVGLVLGDVKQYDVVCPPGTTVDQLDDESQCAGRVFDKNADVPPVVPIVNVVLGFRFKVNEQLTVNLDGGFRNVFYFGLGTDYIF